MEYLTVKDVATLVRRNEETIRRMIRARKLDVTLDNNNRKQGYLISVEQLTRTWDISREEVERYIKKRREAVRREERKAPLGPERVPDEAAPETPPAKSAPEVSDAPNLGATLSDTIARALSQSARRIAQELERVASRAEGSRGVNDAGAAGAPHADDIHIGAAGGGIEEMNDDWNKWVNVDGNDAAGGAPEADNSARGNAGKSGSAQNYSADFSAAGERVSEIIGDAYRQIRRAVEQASAAYNETRAQNEAAAGRAQESHAYTSEHAQNAAEMARRAYEERQAMIRDEIEKSHKRASATASGSVRATGGWAQSINHEGAAKPESDSVKREPVATAPRSSDESSTKPQPVSPKAVPAWEGAKPTKAPEFERFAGKQPDFGTIEVPKVDSPDDNASYQMLQAARKAVEERIRASHDCDGSKPVSLDEKPAAVQVAKVEQRASAEAILATLPEMRMPQAPTNEAVTPEASAPEASAQEVPQLPTQDADAMQRRIEELEAQLSSLSGQIRQLKLQPNDED